MTSVIDNQPLSSFPNTQFDSNIFTQNSQFSPSSQFLELLKLQQKQAPKTPKQASITISDAKKQINDYLATIWKLQGGLHQALLRFELQIRKKWKKMSFAKREAAVKSIWPGMLDRHDDGIHYSSWKHVKTRSRNAFLLPYFNVEDLCRDPSHLMGLLFYRSRNLPEDFVLYDMNEAFMLERPSIQGNRDSKVVVQCYGGKDGGYGKFVEHKEMLDRGDALTIEDAMIVFEAQSELFRFLDEMVTLLVPKPIETSDPFEDESIPPPELMTTICRQKNPSKDWKSTAESNLVQPFSSPPAFSMKRLREIIIAKREESQDRIWILRRDPIYMFHLLKDYDEHRFERIPNPGGYRHPEIERPVYYDRVIGSLVDDVHSDAIVWDMLEREMDRLERIYMIESTEIKIGTALPKDTGSALGALTSLTNQVLLSKLVALSTAIMASPNMRELFERKPHPSLKVGDLDSLFMYDHTLWLILSLAASDSPSRMSRLLDDLDQLLLDNQQEASRISTFLLQRIAEVSSLVEILTIMETHRPNHQPITNSEENILIRGRWKNLSINKKAEFYRLGKFVTPYNRFLQTGAKKDHGKKNHADEALKQLWRVIDENCDSEESKISSILENCLVIKDHDSGTINKRSHKPRQKSVHFPDKISTVLEIKHQPVSATEPPPTPTLKIRPPEPKFQVLERHHKILCKLFPLSSEEDRDIGQIEWKDLVACMTALGFSVEKKRGSDWLFVKSENIEGRNERIIIITEEEKKMSVLGMRTLEKRLTRRFMWSRSVFEVAEKTSA